MSEFTYNEQKLNESLSREEINKIISDLKATTNNWAGSGMNFVDCFKEAAHDPAGYAEEDNFTSKTYPRFIVPATGVVYDGSELNDGQPWETLLEAGEDISKNKDYYINEYGLTFTRDNTNTTAISAAKNILAGVCGIDLKYDGTGIGFRANRAYGVKWQIGKISALTENWQNYYNWFHDINNNKTLGVFNSKKGEALLSLVNTTQRRADRKVYLTQKAESNKAEMDEKLNYIEVFIEKYNYLKNARNWKSLITYNNNKEEVNSAAMICLANAPEVAKIKANDIIKKCGNIKGYLNRLDAILSKLPTYTNSFKNEKVDRVVGLTEIINNADMDNVYKVISGIEDTVANNEKTSINNTIENATSYLDAKDFSKAKSIILTSLKYTHKDNKDLLDMLETIKAKEEESKNEAQNSALAAEKEKKKKAIKKVLANYFKAKKNYSKAKLKNDAYEKGGWVYYTIGKGNNATSVKVPVPGTLENFLKITKSDFTIDDVDAFIHGARKIDEIESIIGKLEESIFDIIYNAAREARIRESI